MTTALYVVGVGYLAVAAGMHVLDDLARLGLVVAGVAAIGVASFPEPAHGTSRSHAVFTGIGAVTIAMWPAIVARQQFVLAAVGVRRSDRRDARLGRTVHLDGRRDAKRDGARAS